MLKLLSNLKTELTTTIKDIEVRELNLNSFEEGLNSVFKNIKPSVAIISGTGGGSLEGEGINNITGGIVEGNPSVEPEIAQQIISSTVDVITNKLVTNNSEVALEALDVSTGSTVTYNKNTDTTTLYSWFEIEEKKDNKGVLLYNYGLTNDKLPLIYCIAFSSDGNKKTIKAYTSKKIHDNILQSTSSWNEKLTNPEETVISPTTGETYYIVAEDSVDVGSTFTNCVYWTMGVCIITADNWEDTYIWTAEEFGFGIDRIPDDFFDSSEITEEDIAKEEDEIKIDNIKTENGNLFTEEQIEEIEQIIKEEVKQAVEQAKQENKTEEQIEQIKQTIIEEKASEYTTRSFKEDFKEQLLSQYKKENSLILFVNNKNDKLSEIVKEISQKIEAINSGEITAEEIEKETEEKAQKILDSLGIDENTTDDEYREIAEKKANELVDAINGGGTDDEVVNAILDNMNDSNGGFNFGLRRDIYERIKSISDFGKDIDCYLYSIGVAEVTARYFTTGVMHVAIHVGGLCIVGVGTSLILSAIQNLINGMQLIQSGTKSTNQIDQAQKLADGISTMYSNGTITSMVIGTMTSALSPIPFVGNGMQTSIQHSSMKIIIMISALAAYIMLMAGGLASMTAGTQKAWDKMLSAIGAKDGNDLFAMLMAAGIKVSLITTIAKTYETTAQSTGTGLLIPFGP